MQAGAQEMAASPPVRVACIGDSVTYGFDAEAPAADGQHDPSSRSLGDVLAAVLAHHARADIATAPAPAPAPEQWEAAVGRTWAESIGRAGSAVAAAAAGPPMKGQLAELAAAAGIKTGWGHLQP